MSVDEVELKYRLSGPREHERLREALQSLGAERVRQEHEQNRLYEDLAGAIVAAGSILRLRILDGGPAARVTFKGPARMDGAVKTRREIEVGVDDADRAHALLTALGYRHDLTYEKVRETWHTGEVEVALDTLVFGHFCELEGPAEAIRALARRLGLDEAQAETAGYPTLMAAWDKHKAKSKRHE